MSLPSLGWNARFEESFTEHRTRGWVPARVAREAEANLLIHPTVGMTKPGDVDHFTRVRCYEAVLKALTAKVHHAPTGV